MDVAITLILMLVAATSAAYISHHATIRYMCNKIQATIDKYNEE